MCNMRDEICEAYRNVGDLAHAYSACAPPDNAEDVERRIVRVLASVRGFEIQADTLAREIHGVDAKTGGG